MSGNGFRLAAMALVIVGQTGSLARARSTDEDHALIVRLVHPDRQAAEVLRLFEGSRAASPAAALAAWKQAAPNSTRLGKPLEAVIALFNGEMVREWGVFHDTELRLDEDPADRSLRWFAIVPHDDGAIAAAITASRLTYPDDAPLLDHGETLAVARLGRSGVPVACCLGQAVIVGSSRKELSRAVLHMRASAGAPARGTAGRGGRMQADGAVLSRASRPLDSGLAFCLIPARAGRAAAGSLAIRRAIALLEGLGCRQVDGATALRDRGFALEMMTTLEQRPIPDSGGRKPAVVEQEWLECVSSSEVMAFVSLAIDPTAAFWDSAFALADRVERVDPARAGVSPIRTRINLVAAASGLKLEADLWPHVRGVSAAISGDTARPGRLTGLRILLHLDEPSGAQRFVEQFAPRMGALLPGERLERDPLLAENGLVRAAERDREPWRLRGVAGRDLTVWRRNKTVSIAWGDDAFTSSARAPVSLARSMAVVCGGWAKEGRGAPQRLGAFWPGRLAPPLGAAEPSPQARGALAGDPPAVWWGWTDGACAVDLLRWPELSRRVRLVLEGLPLDPPRIP
jgi:hypothetical protein